MTTETPGKLLDRIRKLLAKAEDESVTPPEAQALTAKAAELMAKYGIDRALLAVAKPETDAPASRFIDIANPWGRVKAHLLCGLGSALRCQCIMLTRRSGLRIHVFGYASDIERLDVLYTSVLIQMWHALAAAPVPEWTRSTRAWRRSWLLGFAAAVISRVRAAEARAQAQADTARPGEQTLPSAALVLADRGLVIKNAVTREYPVTRTARLTYSAGASGRRGGPACPTASERGRVSNPAVLFLTVPGSGRGSGLLVTSLPCIGSPVAGSAAHSDLFSLAGAVGSATGLSLRSPQAFKIFFRAAGRLVPASPAQFLSSPAEKYLACLGPAGCPPALLRLRAFRRRNTPRTRTPPPGTTPKGARHERHQHLRQRLRDRHQHLRDAGLRDGHHPRRVPLHRRLRPGLRRLRWSPPHTAGRHQDPVLTRKAALPARRIAWRALSSVTPDSRVLVRGG